MKKKTKIPMKCGMNALFKCDCFCVCCWMKMEKDEDGILWILGIKQPSTFLERLRYAFFPNPNKSESYFFEFVLYKKQIKKLKEFIKKL